MKTRLNQLIPLVAGQMEIDRFFDSRDEATPSIEKCIKKPYSTRKAQITSAAALLAQR
jgi:hypothetical protein